jgi:pimeloyl-ACP methyl ester carboxylesterase
MDSQTELASADYILPLEVNGLRGRVAKLPARNKRDKRQILFIYGQHSSLERWWGLIQELSNYGDVTVPDLPGYGGMQSLYSIGRTPTFDALADYLADFISQEYQHEKFDVVGLSIGFAIVTRMLERHPGIVRKINLLVSAVGFAHHDDFVFTKRRQAVYMYGSWFFLHRPLDKLLKHVFFHPWLLRKVYHRSFNAREKFDGLDSEEFKRTMEMELTLWKINDLRTWMRCNIEMFTLDNTQHKVDHEVLHLSARKDRYFDLKKVADHYKHIFSGYDHEQLATDSHGPSVIATREQAAVLIPSKLQKELLKQSAA